MCFKLQSLSGSYHIQYSYRADPHVHSVSYRSESERSEEGKTGKLDSNLLLSISMTDVEFAQSPLGGRVVASPAILLIMCTASEVVVGLEL